MPYPLMELTSGAIPIGPSSPSAPPKLSGKYRRFPRRLSSDKRILVIDDDESIREQLFEVLQPLGYKIDRFDSARRALEYLHVGPTPSVILLDINLGSGMDGWDFAVKIRETPRFHEIPIVALTGFSPEPEHIRNGTLDAILTKPFDLEQFLSRLRMYH